MSDNTPSSIIPLDALDAVMASAESPEHMAAIIAMFTNTFASFLAEIVSEDDEKIKDRKSLIYGQLKEKWNRIQAGENCQEDPIEWIQDLQHYSMDEARAVLARATKRHLRVLSGNHKPYSATRGKGFGDL